MDPRPVCPRCRRPDRVCVCAELRPLESRTRVVFVQHPREARMPVSTCRLAHRSLPNSEMYVAIRPDSVAALTARAREPGTMVLFPGPGSTDVRDLTEPPRALVVVDGSWINARKLVERSPLLSGLPRLGFVPPRPSDYRIRKEPAFHCLSTIEAVAYVLDVLEQAPGRYAPILGSFTRMVDLQLEYVAANANEPRRHAPKPSPLEQVRALGDRLVLLAAEAGGQEAHGRPEAGLLHWVAVRHATGERFEAHVRLESPLGRSAPLDLGLDAFVEGEPYASAIARWRAFSLPGDVAGTWGTFPVTLLREHGIEIEALDLKRLISNVTKGRLGGVEALATRMGAELPERTGRSPRGVVAAGVVVRGMLGG